MRKLVFFGVMLLTTSCSLQSQTPQYRHDSIPDLDRSADKDFSGGFGVVDGKCHFLVLVDGFAGVVTSSGLRTRTHIEFEGAISRGDRTVGDLREPSTVQYSWEWVDGRPSRFQLDGKGYDLATGGVFLVYYGGKTGERVKQIQRELPNDGAVQEFAKNLWSEDAVKSFFRIAPNPGR